MKTKIQRYGIDYQAQRPFEDDTGRFAVAAEVERDISALEWEVRNYKALLNHIASPGAILDDTMRNHIRGVMKFEPAENLGAVANALIARAELMGMVVRIETRPLGPLRMGNYKMVASVQAKIEPR